MFNDLLAQKITVYMRINLGGRNFLMPQQLLDHTDIGTSLQQVCGKGVSEHMRTDFLFYSHRFCVLPDIVKTVTREMALPRELTKTISSLPFLTGI